MTLGPRLDLRQSQSLVMTPQLQQAIRLLALSNLEVEAFIAEELERNPLLEVGRSDEGAADPGDGEPPAAAPPADELTVDQLVQQGDASRDAPLDVEFDSEDFHQDGAGDRLRAVEQPGSSSGEGFDADLFAADEVSLQDHLLTQAASRLSGPDLIIAAAIIEELEETGYFCTPLRAIAERIGAAPQDVERVLAVVQTFDPPGIAARSLSECLTIQAREADRFDPAMARLIANLDYLAKGNMAALKRICGVDDEDLRDMIREIRGYDPKPGCRYARSDRVESISPDVLVVRQKEGWGVELNTSTLPRLLINRAYSAELASASKDRSSRAWLSECLTSASWLVKTLDQRARTIIRVASEIVKHQEAFFERGVAHLRPLTLRSVADAIGMHESTVSRVTSNKYLSCDRGLFELKYFFTSGIQSAEGGEAVSAEAVKSRIRALIAAEDPRRIVSDDQLVESLRAEGFDIARRTVAKYREALGIGSSVQRRRQKALGGTSR